MPYLPSAFAQLLKPLDRRMLARIVDRHNGNRGVGDGDLAWTCQRHLKTLLFGQLAGLAGLRETVEAMAARPAALYHLDLRPPKRSTLSDASAARPSGVFADVARHLMEALGRKLRTEAREMIELIDASPIPLKDARFTWPEHGARTRGLKLYAHFDPHADCPAVFELASPRCSDLTFARKQELKAGVTYVFDKGFAGYGWWQEICAAGASFVTRLKNNAHRREVKEVAGPFQHPVLAEAHLKLGHKKPRGGADNALYETPLREVVVAREGKAPLVLVTNDFDRAATEVAALYKLRWQIELFFKWLKQNLKIKQFWGRSENAVKIQLYVALIAFVLLSWLKTEAAASHKGSLKDLKARLKCALLNPIDLTGNHKPPPRPPALRPPKPQLELAV